MPDVNGRAYALTVLSPIKNGYAGEIAYADVVTDRLQNLGVNEASPMAKVPQTYLARFFVLTDVYYETTPGCDPRSSVYDILGLFNRKYRIAALPRGDHLKSAYLVFSSNFHGDLDPYLRNMWAAANDAVNHVWEHCVAFDVVRDAEAFVRYIKRCQVTANLFFVGSNDEPLDEQLKALYLKQQLARFAVAHQGWDAVRLQQAFRQFIAEVQPENLAGPTWVPGQSRP